MKQLWDAALPIAKNEAKQMQEMIDAEGGNFKLESWDWWFYAEKIRVAKYNLDDNEVRPYFQLDNVRDGAFMVANKLFGITFTKVEDIPLPHPDAEAFEVTTAVREDKSTSIYYGMVNPWAAFIDFRKK